MEKELEEITEKMATEYNEELCERMMYLQELGDAVEEAGLKNDFRIYEIKEKYGQLRVYVNGETDKINRIIND